MTMFFAKKLNKKGFTLAEMLIVVAIIAILVAIAVPIFTSELNKAKVARDKANLRAVRVAASTVILDNDSVDLTGGPWYATVKFTGTDSSDTTTADEANFTFKGPITTSKPSSDLNNTPGKIDYSKNVVVEIKGTDLAKVKIDVTP